MHLLRAERVKWGDVVVRRGEAAHYFVALGEIGIEVGTDDARKLIRLGPGQFFGEIER